ncbi:hypothetical protein [Paenibacillus marinisediminis]
MTSRIRTPLANILLRVLLTAAVSAALIIYGTANRLAVETFLGVSLAVYTGYGVWVMLYSLRGCQYRLRLQSPSHEPFHTSLRCEHSLSCPYGLPRLFIRVTTLWEQVDDSHKTYKTVKVIHSRSRKRASMDWTEAAIDWPAGVYRHAGTTCETGDIWGWFTNRVTFAPLEAELVLLPEAKGWSAVSPYSIPRGLAGDGVNPSPSSGEEGYLGSELRAYRIGDQARSIHWRQYMKSRTLAVRLRQPEEHDAITLMIDDELNDIPAGAIAANHLREEMMLLAGEWLWAAWKQQRQVQVLWLRDGWRLTDPADIARELVLRLNPRYSTSSSMRQAASKYTPAAAYSAVKVAVLISSAEHTGTLERMQRHRDAAGCQLQAWLTVRYHPEAAADSGDIKNRTSSTVKSWNTYVAT